MTLDEILRLDNKLDNLKIIDLYLKKQNKNEANYFSVLLKRLDVTFYSDREKETIEQAISLLEVYKDNTNFKYRLASKLIEFATYIKREDLFLDFLAIKKQLSSWQNEKFLNRDYYTFYLETANYVLAKSYLDLFLNETLEDKVRNQVLLDALKLAFYLKDLNYANLNLAKLIELHKKSFYLDGLISGKIQYLELLSVLNEDLEEFAVSLLNEELTDEEQLTIKTYLLRSYIAKNNLRKIEHLIPSSEVLLPSVSNDIAKSFLTETINFYTQINNKISVAYYERVLASYEQERSSHELEEKERVKRRYRIEIPTTAFKQGEQGELEKIIKNVKTVETKFGVKKLTESEVNHVLVLILKKCFEEDKEQSTRDLLRNILEYAEKKLKFLTLTLVIKKQKYFLYYYVKGRLYEKEVNDLPSSLVALTFKEHRDLFLDRMDNPNFVDCYKLEPFKSDVEVLNLYLNKSAVCELTVLNAEKFDLSLLRLISYLLSTFISFKEQELYNEEIISEFKALNLALNQGVKRIFNNIYHFDESLVNLLGVSAELTEQQFLNKVKVSDQKRYLETLSLVKKDPFTPRAVSYTYKDLTLKETFIPLLNDKTFKIISLIQDVRVNEDIKEHFESLLYYDSNVPNISKLANDLAYIPPKSAFLMFDLATYRFSYQLFNKEKIDDLKGKIISGLQLITNNQFTFSFYYYDHFKYILVIKKNIDKRTLLNDVRVYLETLNQIVKEDKVKVSIYKASESDLSDLKTILANLNIANDSDSGSVTFYKRDFRKRYLFEKDLFTYVNEAINSNKINIRYEEVINVKEGKIEGYKINYSLDNDIYSEEEILKVVRSRGFDQDYLKYKIRLVLDELKTLYDSFKGYLRCFVDLNSNDELIPYLISELGIRKIPLNTITLINGSLDSPFKNYTSNLLDHLNYQEIGYIFDLDAIFNLRTQLKRNIFSSIKDILAINVKDRDEFNYLKELNIPYCIMKNSNKYRIKDILTAIEKQIQKEKN